MVSIFVGSGAGFARGSGATLGAAGILGSGVQGRSGETVSVNAATGNLLIAQQDEFLVGRGPDAAVSRTYNSLAQASDDNGDQWRFGAQRRLQNWTGTANSAGATVDRVGEDGSVVTYSYDVGLGYYRATDGAGAHDRIVNVGHWIWTDGDTQTTEGYDVGGVLLGITDTDGNSVSFTYHAHTAGWRLSRATTANGEYQEYQWSGENVSQIVTGYTDLATGTAKTLTRTRYAYDGQNRLVQVTVDLSPNDNSVADGKTYVTTYTYDGSSKRVASITQTDGSSLAIAYDASGRVTTLTQIVGPGDVRVTALSYGPSFTDVTSPDGQVTRLEYTGGNIGSSALQDWIAGGLNWEAAGSIGGESAIKFTSAPGATWSAISWGTQAQAGDIFTLTANLMAVPGSSTSQTLGLYGYNSYWGTSGSSARIISGPGQLVHGGGGNWKVIGLSTTEATRIEVTRTYAQAENIGAYLYVDDLDGFRDGQQLVMAGVTLAKGDANAVAPKQLSRIISPPASAGAPRQVMEFVYSPNGDLIETRTGTLGENLLDLDGWAGEWRGPNLLDLSGWPINPDSLPGGNATLAGWANPSWTIGEARWAKTTGPQGGPVAVIQTGQTDGLDPGGGNYSHGFTVDTSKAYEFSTYFQVTDLNKHRLYFGLDGQNAVVNALDGTPDGNPYFAYPHPGLDGVPYQAGRWYRIVGYVLPAGAGNLQAVTDLGGIYDVETGERIADVMNYRWADTQPSGSPQGGVRFFNYYSQSVQGYYTNYYRPEVHEINLPGGAGTVQNWYNWHAEETRWASTIGPDGKQAFVIEAGQINATIGGGGNHSSYVDVDRGKAYEFTYYFQFTDTGKHSIYFGLHGPLGVEQLHDGAANSNPYFFAIGPDQQPANFAEGRWYKVVGYVLPSGSTAVPADQMGGVYDTVTGEKILDLWSNFRWSSSGSDTRIGVRFFNFYYENNLQYSTHFGKPEMREAPHRVATSGGYVGYAAAAITDRKFFKYDTRGNLIETRDNEGNIVTCTYGAKNELLTETRIGSDASGAAVAHKTRYVYDSENHLRYVISPEGRVTEYIYTATGEIASRIEYTEHGYPIGSMPPTEAEVVSWRGGIADKQGDKIVTYLYDARGNQIQEVDYGYAAAAGYGVTSEGYAHHYFAYDQTGRLLSRVTATLATETFLYDGLGRMVGSTDLAGGTTTIVFNDAALTTTVTTASGGVTVSSYNKTGDLVGTTHSGYHVTVGSTSHLYDKNGRVRVATDAAAYKTYYLYDSTGRTVGEIDHYGYLTEFRYDAAGRIAATARYMTPLSASQIAMLGGPDTAPNVADIRPGSHAYDQWSWSIYDDAGRLIQSIDGTGGVAVFSYDGSNRLVKTQRYYNKLSAGQLAGFKAASPIALALPTADTRDTVSRSFYDRDGRLIGALDGEGYLTEVVYDKAGQKVEEIAYAAKTSSSYWATGTFNELRSTAAMTSSANRRAHYVYDGQGLLRFSVDNAGYVTEYVYKSEVEWGAIGLVRSTIRHAVAIATSDFTYDNVKALVAVNASNAANRTSWSVYDAAGRMTYAIDADGAVTSFTYDVAGNVIKSVAFAVQRATSSLPSEATMDSWRDANIGNAANRITRNWYTAGGDLRFIVDPEGYVKRFDYDARGQVSSEYQWNAPYAISDTASADNIYSLLVGDAGYVGSWYSHDEDGNLATERLVDANGLAGSELIMVHDYDPSGLLGNIFRGYGTADQSLSINVYDSAGRLSAEYSAYGEPEQSVVQYGYDGLGNLVSTTDARGKVTYSTYDERGLVLTKTDAAGGVTSYEYNAFGEVVKTTDPAGGVTYSYYDSLGRVTSVRDAENYVTETSYNQFGEIATVTRRYNRTTSPVSTTTPPTVTAHTQDATTSFEYGKRGLVTKTTDAEGWFESYGYDAFGNRTSVIAKSKDANKVAGGATTYAYDRRGLLVRETLPAASYDNNGGALLSSLTGGYDVSTTYVYDARGNRIRMIEAAGLPEARTTDYVYDKANRLTQTRRDVIRVVPATGQNIVETRIDQTSYDARGNVTSTTDGAGARTVYYYDDLDRVVVTINAGGTYTSNVYDANGNVTATRVYDAGMAIPADGGSEEEKPAAPGGIYRETTFTYDNLNRLLTSSVAGVTSYIFNGSGYAVQATNLTTTYEYSAAGDVVRSFDANGNATYHYYDRIGNKTASLDAAGYLTAWSYDGEGNVLVERRYAARFTGSPTMASPPSVATSGADRVTQYSYDRNGNRTIEQRLDVLVHNGAGSTSNVHATINYQYNGLGQVVRKIEATGEDIQYLYDSAGRVGREIRSAFTSHQGSSVSPTIDYFYNGLGDLTRTVAAGAGDAASRVTRYQYGTGGVLEWVQDASGQTVYHYQDIVGRNPGTLTIHQRSDGTLLSSREYSLQDHLGRVTEKLSYYYDNSTGWDWGTPYRNVYNAYGDVVTKTVNGGVTAENRYDAAGRLIATTAGDGIWKHFGYDANGNQTIAITSAGASLAGLSFAQALALVGQENVTATYTQYDARGQAVGVTEEQRRLSGSTVQNLTSSRTYNAFGELVSETNAAGATTTYSYNNIGRMIRSEGPTVQITLENGATQWVKRSQDHYYDASGRLVASRDANGSYAGGGTSGNGTSKDANTGNLTRLTLLAGTGYNGSAALVTHETHADGGVKQTRYDVHGDARVLIDEIGRTTTQSFDAMGRVTQVNHAGGLTDTYAYDGLGQRIKHWNSFLGAGDVETTDYDTQGRVIKTRAFGGDVTTTSYAWDGALATAGLGTFGGWVQTVSTDADRASGSDGIVAAVQKTDIFGRVAGRTDKGGQVYSYSYDTAGRMLTETSVLGGAALRNSAYSYYNSGRISQIVSGDPVAANTNWARKIAAYEYDPLGRLTRDHLVQEQGTYTEGHWVPPENPGGPPMLPEFPMDPEGDGWTWVPESYSVSSTQLQDGRASYDAADRMTRYRDVAQYGGPDNVDKAWTYDAADNVRSILTSYRPMQANGWLSGTVTTQAFWYRYDAMNRVVTTKGSFVGTAGSGSIVRGTAGTDIAYNGASERATAQTGSAAQEVYGYTAAGLIASVTIGGVTRASTSYDALGRVTGYTEYNASAQAVHSRHSIVYDARGLVLAEKGTTRQGADWIYTHTVNNYSATGSGSASPAISWSGQVGTSTGSLLYYSETKNWKNGSASPVYGAPGSYSQADLDYADSYQSQVYGWRDGAVQTSVTLVNRDGSSSSSYTYGMDGALRSVGITGGTRPRSIVFATDLGGQVLARNEYDNNYSVNDPGSRTWMFGGTQMGSVGNDGTGNVDYAASIAARTAAPGTGAFRGGATSATIHADFDANFTALNGSSAGGGGSYSVNAGDTLQGIAAQLWGDANLWYKLAEANPGAASGLTAGMTLTVPGGVMGTHHNSATSKPYDPAEAIGNTSPNTPMPPKAKNKCGVFGQILVAAIAVAVVALSQQYQLFAGLGPVLGGAATAATASIVSQGFGVATGIQDKFSWRGVALAAIAGGVTGGLGPKGAFGADGAFGKLGSELATDALRGVVGNVVSQGIGAATGLQSKFDFAGVAAAGIGGGVSSLIGDAAAKAGFGSIGASLAANTARGIANAATRSAINGNSFGDNFRAALPDIISGALGDGISGRYARARENLNADLVAYGAADRAAMGVGALRSVDLPPSMTSGGTAGQEAAIAITGSRASVTGGVMLLDDPVLGSSGGAVTGSAAQSGGVDTSAITYGGFTMRLGGTTPLSTVIDQNFMIADFGGAFDEYVQRGGDDWVVDLLSGELGQGGAREGYLGNVLLSLGSMTTSASAGGIADRLGQRLDVSTIGDVSVIFDPSFAAFAGTPAFDTSDPLAAAIAASGHSYVPSASQSSRYTSPGWLDMVSDYSPVKFNRVYEDVANLPRDIRKNGLNWFLRDQPPTLGGGVTTITTGAAKGTSAIWNLIKPGTAAIDDLAPVVIHGNSKLSPRPATLYELWQYGDDGVDIFLKHGISHNPATRYSKTFMEDKFFREVATGSRSDMLILERQRVIQNPGPLNLEPWAVKARAGQ